MDTDFKRYADFQKYNFFRRPQWRWERVVRLTDRIPTPGRCSKRDDDFVRRARNFYLKYSNRDLDTDREDLWQDEPGLYYAYQFFLKQLDDEGRRPTAFLQARILSGQPHEDICRGMDLHPDTVRWYEALFFNVGDRLHNRDWVTDQILVPAFTRQAPAVEDEAVAQFKDSSVAHPFLDGSLKLFSYFGGPIVAEAMIAGMRGGNVLSSREEYQRWMDRTWSDAVRRRSAQAAMTFEINKYNVLELFAVHTRIMELDRSDESQDQQKTSVERHIKALMDEIPWAVGQDGRTLYQGTALGRLDEMATELRDDEILRLASGQPVPGLSDGFLDRLPPPRKQREAILMAPSKGGD